MGVEHEELYSLDQAIRVNVSEENNNNKKNKREAEVGGGEEKMVRGVAAEIRKNFQTTMDKVLEKLAAASAPADAMENARHFFESVIRDVTIAAYGLTKDALLRIKTHLVDLLPSLSPKIVGKMVDDAEKDIGNGQSEDGDDDHQRGNRSSSSSKAPFMSLAASLISSLVKPLSRL